MTFLILMGNVHSLRSAHLHFPPFSGTLSSAPACLPFVGAGEGMTGGGGACAARVSPHSCVWRGNEIAPPVLSGRLLPDCRARPLAPPAVSPPGHHSCPVTNVSSRLDQTVCHCSCSTLDCPSERTSSMSCHKCPKSNLDAPPARCYPAIISARQASLTTSPVIVRYCHSERSEESLVGLRFFASLRMTGRMST